MARLLPGAGTAWGIHLGRYEAEALKNIDGVVRMVVESLLKHGESVPEEPANRVQVTIEPRVAVTV